VQLAQLQIVAYALQLVEAVVRRSADFLKAAAQQKQASKGMQQGPAPAYVVCHTNGYAVVKSALSMIGKVGDAALRSLQGQLLLQSCTSLLLTCDSRAFIPNPLNLSLCVQLLQLLRRSEAQAAGGTRHGMSQSLAAGVTLLGRLLVTLGTELTPDDYSGSSSSMSCSLLYTAQQEKIAAAAATAPGVSSLARSGTGCVPGCWTGRGRTVYLLQIYL
jgi:hypothetical protein